MFPVYLHLCAGQRVLLSVFNLLTIRTKLIKNKNKTNSMAAPWRPAGHLHLLIHVSEEEAMAHTGRHKHQSVRSPQPLLCQHQQPYPAERPPLPTTSLHVRKTLQASFVITCPFSDRGQRRNNGTLGWAAWCSL